MCHRNCRKKALRFPDFVANACCNPCCDTAVQAAVVSAASDTNPCCGCCCCCGCCGCGNVGGAGCGCGNVGGANTGCGCGRCGNVAGTSTGCGRGNVAGASADVCDVSGIWDLPPRFPGCGFRPYCPCDADPYYPIYDPVEK